MVFLIIVDFLSDIEIAHHLVLRLAAVRSPPVGWQASIHTDEHVPSPNDSLYHIFSINVSDGAFADTWVARPSGSLAASDTLGPRWSGPEPSPVLFGGNPNLVFSGPCAVDRPRPEVAAYAGGRRFSRPGQAPGE